MATAFTRTLSVGSRGRKTTSNVPVRAEEGRTKARRGLRGSGRIVGAGPVRLSGHKLSFVCSMSPEIAGTVHSTVCALHLNKAGKEGEGVMCKTKLR